MLKNYFRIALRNLMRYRFFSAVNIFGLAVSMSACLLIITMLADQKKFDKFNTKKDRIYRIISSRPDHKVKSATSPAPLHDELLTSYPGAKEIVSMRAFIGGDIKYKDNIVTQAGYYADSGFFELFDFQLNTGDPASALRAPYSMVMTESMSKKLFGDEDPAGKTVSFADRRLDVLGIGIESEEKRLGDFVVTGVIRDLHYKSHLRYDFLVSMSTLHSLVNAGTYQAPFNDWKNLWEFYNYVLLEEGKSGEDLQASLDQISDIKYKADTTSRVFFEAQPLTGITPGKLLNNMPSFSLPIEAYYFLSILCGVVLLSACFNYTNLSLARSLTRAREIGLRKISGAARYQVFFQFISEAVVISLVALIFAVILLQLLKRGISGFWLNQFLTVGFNTGIYVLLIFILFSVLTGMMAGLLPSVYLSSFSPLQIMTRNFTGTARSKGSFFFTRPTLGKSLIVAQFVFSMVLILSTITLYAQLRHLMVAKYGFDRDNIINIRLNGNEYRQMANEFSKNPDVVRISASNVIPAMGFSYGVEYKTFPGMEDSTDMSYFAVDQNYIDNLGLTLVAGRNFPATLSDSTEQYVILNETAVKEMGFADPAAAIGAYIVESSSSQPVEVIGVLKDFNFELFMDKIGGLALRYIPKEFRHLNVKVSGTDLAGTVSFLEKKWKSMDQVHPFDYKFFDQQLAKSNAIFGDILSIVGFIAFLAISISSLGLLGMATYTAESRRKEVGIRKAMGAEVKGILFLLSKGFVFLMLIATAIAIPLTLLINNAWLQKFAYRISLGPAIIFTGILIVFLIGLFTIGSQTLKAALSNPAAILREE